MASNQLWGNAAENAAENELFSFTSVQPDGTPSEAGRLTPSKVSDMLASDQIVSYHRTVTQDSCGHKKIGNSCVFERMSTMSNLHLFPQQLRKMIDEHMRSFDHSGDVETNRETIQAYVNTKFPDFSNTLDMKRQIAVSLFRAKQQVTVTLPKTPEGLFLERARFNADGISVSLMYTNKKRQLSVEEEQENTRVLTIRAASAKISVPDFINTRIHCSGVMSTAASLVYSFEEDLFGAHESDNVKIEWLENPLNPFPATPRGQKYRDALVQRAAPDTPTTNLVVSKDRSDFYPQFRKHTVADVNPIAAVSVANVSTVVTQPSQIRAYPPIAITAAPSAHKQQPVNRFPDCSVVYTSHQQHHNNPQLSTHNGDSAFHSHYQPHNNPQLSTHNGIVASHYQPHNNPQLSTYNGDAAFHSHYQPHNITANAHQVIRYVDDNGQTHILEHHASGIVQSDGRGGRGGRRGGHGGGRGGGRGGSQRH